MWRIIPLAIMQGLLLTGGQVLLKFSLNELGAFQWTREFFFRLLTCWWLLACGLCYAASTVLWLHILKKFPFSMAYPMISLSYVFGMFAAIIFFHEQIPLTRWIGVGLIIAGVFVIAK